MLLFCYVEKHVFHIPPVLVIWRRTTSQTGAFATAASIFRAAQPRRPTSTQIKKVLKRLNKQYHVCY
jgi:hypothetical protein